MHSGRLKPGQRGLPVLVMPKLRQCLSRDAPALRRECPQPLALLPAFPPLLLQTGAGSVLASPPSQPIPLGKSCDGCSVRTHAETR